MAEGLHSKIARAGEGRGGVGEVASPPGPRARSRRGLSGHQPVLESENMKTFTAQRPRPNVQRPARRSRNQDGRMIWGQNHWIQIILPSNHSASDLIPFPKSTVSIPNLRTVRRICALNATNFRTDCPTRDNRFSNVQAIFAAILGR